MEVKDVTKVTDPGTLLTVEKPDSSDSVTSNSKNIATIESTDEVDLSLASGNVDAITVNEDRLKTNSAIGAVHIVAEKTEKIGKLLKSVAGIVDQAEGASEEVRPKLEAEGKDLVKEIEKVSHTTTPDGLAPVAGDKIRIEIEKSIGQALDIIFPGEAAKAFGLQELSFSTKETIINTRSVVARAQAQYESLRDNVSKVAEQVRALTTAVDGVAKTKDSIKPAVRAVDDAVQLTSDTRSAITTDPSRAIGSIGEADAHVLQ